MDVMSHLLACDNWLYSAVGKVTAISILCYVARYFFLELVMVTSHL
jgi:hypothetical protein